MVATDGEMVEAEVAGNQRQIPVIQTDDGNVTQLQQNSNKVLRNLSNQIDSQLVSINEMTIIGEVKFASLTLEQFQDIAGTNWILANGQSSVGTKYALLTGSNTVPTVTLAGTTTFIRVN